MMRAIVWDLDGVLACNDHAMFGHTSYHHLSEDEWTQYHTMLDDCAVNEPWAILYQSMGAQRIANIVLTNRSEDQRDMTRDWLCRHDLFPDMLLMRDPGTPHEGAKARRLIEAQQAGYIVMLAIDDDPEHCSAYEEMGVPALYVHSGYHADRQRIPTLQ
jgi:hypothetical protein